MGVIKNCGGQVGGSKGAVLSVRLGGVNFYKKVEIELIKFLQHLLFRFPLYSSAKNDFNVLVSMKYYTFSRLPPYHASKQAEDFQHP